MNIYYHYNKHDYEIMEDWFIKSINKGNKSAMFQLGWYYQVYQKYEQMEFYYMMAIEHDNYMGLIELLRYYKENGMTDKASELETAYLNMRKTY